MSLIFCDNEITYCDLFIFQDFEAITARRILMIVRAISVKMVPPAWTEWTSILVCVHRPLRARNVNWMWTSARYGRPCATTGPHARIRTVVIRVYAWMAGPDPIAASTLMTVRAQPASTARLASIASAAFIANAHMERPVSRELFSIKF